MRPKLKTSRTLSDEVLGIAPNGKERHLNTSISYSKGGTSYLSGNIEPRGYWLIVRIEDVRDGIRSFLLFTGGRKMFIEEARAFSAKRLAYIVPDPEKVTALQDTMRFEGMQGVITTATTEQVAS